jgi:hypothetical protein
MSVLLHLDTIYKEFGLHLDHGRYSEVRGSRRNTQLELLMAVELGDETPHCRKPAPSLANGERDRNCPSYLASSGIHSRNMFQCLSGESF